MADLLEATRDSSTALARVPLVVGRCHPASVVGGEAGPGEVVVSSDRSPAKSTDNEDGAAIVEIDGDRLVLVVADGVGGHRDGAEAAERALRAIVECLEATASRDEPALRSSILDGFELANRRVSELGTGGATTLAVVEIDGATARPYHVGDSMILVVGQRGRLRHRTVSHSPVGYGVEAGLLDPDEALHHADRHLVSNIVGAPDMRIDVGPTLHLQSRDTVVLATDGLFDNLLAEEIIAHVRKGPLAKAAVALGEAARWRMERPEAGEPSKPDDMTFVLYRGLR